MISKRIAAGALVVTVACSSSGAEGPANEGLGGTSPIVPEHFTEIACPDLVKNLGLTVRDTTLKLKGFSTPRCYTGKHEGPDAFPGDLSRGIPSGYAVYPGEGSADELERLFDSGGVRFSISRYDSTVPATPQPLPTEESESEHSGMELVNIGTQASVSWRDDRGAGGDRRASIAWRLTDRGVIFTLGLSGGLSRGETEKTAAEIVKNFQR